MDIRSNSAPTIGPTALGLIASSAVLLAASAGIPSVQTCVEEWNDSGAPAQVVNLFGTDQSSVRVVVNRWHDSETAWDESGCRIAVTDAETGVVIGAIDGDAAMTVEVVGPGPELHDWASRHSEYEVLIRGDGTIGFR